MSPIRTLIDILRRARIVGPPMTAAAIREQVTAMTDPAEVLAALDYTTPCMAGPEGLVLTAEEPCTEPALFLAHVHYCSEHDRSGMVAITWCPDHVGIYALGMRYLLTECRGILPCGFQPARMTDLIRIQKLKDLQ